MLPLAIQVKRLRILIVSRLFIAAFLLFYAQFVFSVEAIVFYGIIAFISGLSVFYVFWLLYGKYLRFLAYFQIVCDLLLESFLIYYTGGVDSLFSAVYVLSILSAGIVLTPAASFFTAVGSTLCYIGTLLLIYARWSVLELPRPLFGNEREAIYLFYAGYVHVTIFFLVAALAYYFLQKIEQLEGKMKLQERLVFLGEVVSSIAHEIRNPLTSISASIELISKRLSGQLGPKQEKLMNAVVDESERLNRIFNGLLDYSRPPQLHLEKVLLKPFMDDVLMLMRHQESYHSGIRIEALYQNKDIEAMIDPENMKQVLMNVINNAFQAMPAGGMMKADIYTNRLSVVVSIEDTGGGIDKKTLNSIFVPFKTTKSKGTGLGLAHAYKIVSRHGGQIAIQTKRGKGTRIEVHIPKV